MKRFLGEQIALHDAVMLQVLYEVRPQHLQARIGAIYSSRKGIKPEMEGRSIEFVHASSAWGNIPLSPGQTALVFLSEISGRLYEASWNGHMLIDAIDGEPYVSYRYSQLWLSENMPSNFRDCIRQDPRRPKCSAIKLQALVEYIRQEH